MEAAFAVSEPAKKEDRTMARLACLLLCGALVASLNLSAAGAPELSVDCGKGEDLQRALNQLDRLHFGTVHVTGMCVGSFTVSGDASIQILGNSKDTAGIQANVVGGVALWALDRGYVEVHDMTLAGAYGLYASGSARSAVLVDCAIVGNVRGVWADSGASVLLQQSSVSGKIDSGIAAFGSEVIVQSGLVHDSAFGARLSRSRLVLGPQAEVSGNTIGVLAEDWSVAEADGASFANSAYHLIAEGGSRVSTNNIHVGASGDSTIFAAYATGNGVIGMFQDDPGAEIWGTVALFDDSSGILDGVALHGDVHVDGFSRLRLNAAVPQGIYCEAAGDAWCGPAASGTATGCASARGTCTPAVAGAIHVGVLRPPPAAPFASAPPSRSRPQEAKPAPVVRRPR
jgi:hypothetical protein